MVMKSLGLPYVRTYVIASICRSCMYRGPPVNVDGKMTRCPAFRGSKVSLTTRDSCQHAISSALYG